jgi:hypothetical protein
MGTAGAIALSLSLSMYSCRGVSADVLYPMLQRPPRMVRCVMASCSGGTALTGRVCIMTVIDDNGNAVPDLARPTV